MTHLLLSHSQLKQQLHANGYSLTKPRLAVFRVLEKGPASNAAVGRALSGTVDRVSVYRTIQLFENINVVQRVWHGRQSQVKLSEIYTSHYHHAKCVRCGEFIAFQSKELEQAIIQAADGIEFSPYKHDISLTGTCKACQL